MKKILYDLPRKFYWKQTEKNILTTEISKNVAFSWQKYFIMSTVRFMCAIKAYDRRSDQKKQPLVVFMYKSCS